MLQFIDGTAQQFEDLYRNSRGSCLRFRNSQLPPGCTPARADIGFEAPASGDGLVLLVQTGIRYVGANAAVRQWLQSGSKSFASLTDFTGFCRTDLRNWFETNSSRTAAPDCETSPTTCIAPPRSDVATASRILRQGNRRSVQTAAAIQSGLAARVHGQPAALAAVAERVAAHCNRVAPRRPATLFFVGPTGVGKTRTAECLPEVLNGEADSAARWQYLRLDMNEYREAHRISQLIGSPQGYVGFGEGAQLTRQLARHPRTIVLFDEIEKAHPDIFLALMNAMDSGRLSSATAIDGQHEIDCRQAIFAFTSNLSADGIVREVAALPAADAGRSDLVSAICQRHLRDQRVPPELIGRISTYAVFRPISDEARLQIALSGLAAVAHEFGLQIVSVEPAALAQIVGGQEARLGARTDEYRIDALLGQQFAQLASEGATRARVVAAPLHAVAIDDASSGTAGESPEGHVDLPRC